MVLRPVAIEPAAALQRAGTTGTKRAGLPATAVRQNASNPSKIAEVRMLRKLIVFALTSGLARRLVADLMRKKRRPYRP